MTDRDEETAREIAPCLSCRGDPRGEAYRTESWFGAAVTYGMAWRMCVTCDGKGATITAKKIAAALRAAREEGAKAGIEAACAIVNGEGVRSLDVRARYVIDQEIRALSPAAVAEGEGA